jgi:hypothetical protein
MYCDEESGARRAGRFLKDCQTRGEAVQIAIKKYPLAKLEHSATFHEIVAREKDNEN